MDERIAERLDEILYASWNPGADQVHIRKDFQDLETILNHLETEEDSRARSLTRRSLLKLEEVAERVTRYILSPRIVDRSIKRALEEVRADALEIYSKYSNPEKITSRRLIIPRRGKREEKSLLSLKAQHTDFQHIPYSFIDRDVLEVQRELKAAGIHGHREKTYRIIPLHKGSGEQWNLELIGAPAAWNVSRGQSTQIGIIDTGCDYTHPALIGRFGEVKGYNFIANNEDPMDDNGHGTHVAGSAAGEGIGVANQATLYALKFLDEDGFGTEVGFIQAAEWAINNGLQVLNGSFGSTRASDAEEAICDALQEHNVLFCAAAGNGGIWEYHFPASYASVIAVAAVDERKVRAPFSQINDKLDLSAPGVLVYSSLPGGKFGEYSGTSMACPHVAGSLALTYSVAKNPGFARDLLLDTADTLGDSEEYGRGLVRPDKAVRIAVKAWEAVA